VALAFGAEGVGLFRTEYLFLNRQSMPTEEEQFAAYREVASVLGERPLTIRTLDVGGDKQLTYLPLDNEQNPFLGWRAIRLCLDRPELFQPQLRAILRAGTDRDIHIMFPMVTVLDEIRRARQAVERAMGDLRAEGIAFQSDPKIGIMIEVPAAAIMADVLAKEVDFVSIGTNDLIQYSVAVDRMNERVAYLYEPLGPAILRLVSLVIEKAHQQGIWAAMCGEMAGDLTAIPLLLGMGLDEFSINPTDIPAAKQLIRTLHFERMQELAHQALQLGSSDQVRQLLSESGLRSNSSHA